MAPLATPDDVATRLGRALTAEEDAMVEALIADVTGLIADEVDQNVDWLEALSPIPAALKLICIRKAIVAGTNPNGLQSESKQIGQMSRSRTFGVGDGGSIYLTDEERTLASAAVYGDAPVSSSLESFFDRIIDLREWREVDEDPPA